MDNREDLPRVVRKAESQLRAPGCPDEAQWFDFAAGLTPLSERSSLLTHASECAHCGPLLRMAVQTLADRPTEEEETVLRSAGEMRIKWPAPPPPAARTLRWWPAAAAAAIVAGPLLTWQVMRNQPAPVMPVKEVLVEKLVTAPVIEANVALLDLFPAGNAERGASGAPAVKVPATALVTVVLHEAPAAPAVVRVLDARGQELRSSPAPVGEKSIVLDAATLRQRPLTIECLDRRYRLP